MPRLTEDQLRRETLRRQFPDVDGRDPGAVVALVDRLGPIQSQVPRSPLLAVSSRLPGADHATVSALFDGHRLVKASTLRGTVHTSTAGRLPLLDAVARSSRARPLARLLGLSRVSPPELMAELERFCTDEWRTRDEVVDHARGWLAERESPAVAAAIVGSAPEGFLWGHSGLLRRPYDGRWERRTDSLRRTATAVLGPSDVTVEDALVDLVRGHLAAYGPVLREDLTFFFGASIRQVSAALARLGDEVVRLEGPGSDAWLDLAEPPTGGNAEPGVRLLPEFDGLLLGFAGPQRDRFLPRELLPRVWAKANGLFSPVVLADGHLVATWRTITRGRRTTLEVTMLPPHPPLAESVLAGPLADTARVLDQTIDDVRVLVAT